jgi:hypothetical protein
MKLYQYYEDCGRMGSIEGLLILTDEEVTKYKQYTEVLYWDELLGKHSEGNFLFSDDTLTVIDIPEDVVKILHDKIGKVVSGPFDLDYFDELIQEAFGKDSDEWEDEDDQ